MKRGNTQQFSLTPRAAHPAVQPPAGGVLAGAHRGRDPRVRAAVRPPPGRCRRAGAGRCSECPDWDHQSRSSPWVSVNSIRSGLVGGTQVRHTCRVPRWSLQPHLSHRDNWSTTLRSGTVTLMAAPNPRQRERRFSRPCPPGPGNGSRNWPTSTFGSPSRSPTSPDVYPDGNNQSLMRVAVRGEE